MYLKVLGFISIILLLSNCANMNKSDCLTANWQLIGFEDGSLGKNESQISQHRKECSEHGVTPDLSAYRKGHFEGSKLFCTTNNGFTRGSQGKDYDRSCPQQFEAAFLIGFSEGQTLYGLKKVLNQRAADLESAYKELDWLEHTIAEKSELMIADGLNRKQRIVVRDEIAQYQQQQVELYDLLPELKYEFENAHQAYEQGKDAFSGY
ncbi:hypothetical protein GARC_2710 [Paraglaciecola arctica BSs20135]|uniref:DUF2799 domain-containing protein n=2 Tax=Paraglaciecola TaxID=1621534 RepID=K6Z885_9ALTE|nr:hypothetical protein GARC_2710 [Paraglaciecola arctica BSs20135]